MASASDDELIARAQSGDTAAYGDLVRRYQDLAFRTAWVILRHEQDAQDATQTAFLKAWQALDRFRSGEPFRPWLLRIVANEAKNRRESRWRWFQTHLFSERQPEITDDYGLEALVARTETSAELLKAISQLPIHDQQILLLRYALDLAESEIATTLGIPRGTVKSRLHRALNRLREVVTNDE
ncbi:MAG: sigma-70 family RNA polymerase sigma factor [Thermomicrobiales bacterium]|nr:sigma-70 family RNA polymerase sigma factor [Thermomicrobiales bacterium]